MSEATNKIMAKVQAMLAKADSTTFEAERIAFLAKAEQFMREYRITESELIATDPTSILPMIHALTISRYSSRYSYQYRLLLASACTHAGVRWTYARVGDDYVATLYGYDGDLRLAEMLYSAARIVFSTRMEPQVDPSVSDQVNAYNLRNSGLLRRDIAIKLWGDNTPALRSKAQRLYVAECTARGEVPNLAGLATDADTYREAYVRGFVDTFRYRLRSARDAADGNGGVMVFAGREQAIDDLFYEHNPMLRPVAPTDVATPTDNLPDVPCKACLRAKSGHCRQHPGWRWSSADERRYQRTHHSDAARLGEHIGGTAARSVDLDRSSTMRVDTPTTTRPEISG